MSKSIFLVNLHLRVFDGLWSQRVLFHGNNHHSKENGQFDPEAASVVVELGLSADRVNIPRIVLHERVQEMTDGDGASHACLANDHGKSTNQVDVRNEVDGLRLVRFNELGARKFHQRLAAHEGALLFVRPDTEVGILLEHLVRLFDRIRKDDVRLVGEETCEESESKNVDNFCHRHRHF